jgi:hypothetical protein
VGRGGSLGTAVVTVPAVVAAAIVTVTAVVAVVAAVGTSMLGDGDALAPADRAVELPGDEGRSGDDERPLGSPQRRAPAPAGPGCERAGCLAWSLPIRGAANSPVIGLQGGLLLLVQGRHLTGIDTEQGGIRWRTPVDVGGGPLGAAALATSANEVLVVDAAGRLRSIGLEDGRTRWSSEVGHAVRVTQAEVVGDVLFVVTSERGAGENQLLSALDPSSGELRWQVPVGGRVTLTGAGPVLVEPSTGALRGVEPRDGAPTWDLDLPGEIEQVRPFGDWVVVIGGDATTVLDGAEGATIGTFPAGSFQAPGPDHGALLILGSEEVSYLDPEGRSWTRPLPGPCCRGTALTAASVRLLRTDGVVTELARSDGSRTREWALPGLLHEGAGRLLGGYLFTRSAQGSDMAISDVVTGARITLVPGTRLPVGLTDGGGLILVGDQGVAALEPLPARDPAG